MYYNKKPYSLFPKKQWINTNTHCFTTRLHDRNSHILSKYIVRKRIMVSRNPSHIPSSFVKVLRERYQSLQSVKKTTRAQNYLEKQGSSMIGKTDSTKNVPLLISQLCSLLLNSAGGISDFPRSVVDPTLIFIHMEDLFFLTCNPIHKNSYSLLSQVLKQNCGQKCFSLMNLIIIDLI